MRCPHLVHGTLLFAGAGKAVTLGLVSQAGMARKVSTEASLQEKQSPKSGWDFS